MRSLYFKFAVALASTSILGAVIVAFMARGLTYRAFSQFNAAEVQAEITDKLTVYFQENGGWEEVEGIFKLGDDNPQAEDIKVIPFVILDPGGEVLASVPPMDPGMIDGIAFSQDIMDGAITIMVDDENAGQVIFSRKPEINGPAERGFFMLVDKASIWAALAGISISIILSLVFTRQFTRPISDLSQAALQISEGNLGQQVQIKRNDEIGVLAESFNLMSAELQKSDRQRKQMTADIAHELRNPMTVLGIHLEGLKDGTLELTDERIDILFNVHHQLWRIIDDLRDLSLADANELPLNKTDIQPGATLQMAVYSYLQMATEKGILLSVTTPDDLPMIHVDPQRFSQVIGNLIRNALDNTPEGGKVRIEALAEDEWLVINIIDNGVGIPVDEIPRIFQRFYRIDPSRQSKSGNSGLGLAIARSLTETHGGKISVKSTLGEGSTFTVLFPFQT